MENYHFTLNKEITSYKSIFQLLLILLVEVFVFIINCKYTLIHNKYPGNIISNKNHTSLVLVQVLFRHGERTPVIGRSYPSDPYINHTYEPYGDQALTDKGERTMYKTGNFLRNYYGDFLGEYHPNIVYAQSSPLKRCRNSLLLVLAALFPPSFEKRLDPSLKWQPIEYNYNPIDTDNIFYSLSNCPKFVSMREEGSRKLMRSKELGNLTELLRYLESHSGMKINTLFELSFFYDHLLIQTELGLQLPEWTKNIFPTTLWSYAYNEILVTSKTDALKRLSGGFLLKEMMDVIQSKLQDTPQSRKRKLHLYSGHSYNVWMFLGTLGITVPTRPTYGCFVSLELHKIDNQYGIKVIYHNYEYERPVIIKLPDCNELCPMTTFWKLYEKYKATSDMCL